MRDETRDRAALGLYLAAVVAGGLLRLWDLPLRPLHHDEGVNSLFLLDLVKEFRYKYDPANYHGPLLYFTVAPLLLALGLKTWVLRLAPAVIGTATLALFWPLRRAIGRWGAVSAAWLLALSPTTVFFNRDLIHETWFVAAGALVAGASAAYTAERGARYVLLVWIGLAAFIATKETAPIMLGALAAGALVAGLLVRGRDALRVAFDDAWRGRVIHLWGLILATAILALLFTSFFSNPRGFLDMGRAYMFWARTGKAGAGHEKPWPYFFEILWRYERTAYVLGFLGLFVALARREAAAAFGTAAALFLGAHAMIPYKTPWLVIGVVPWLAASAGYLVDRTLRAIRSPLLAGMAVLLFSASLVLLGIDAHRLSFLDYDDDRESIVYSQTMRDFLDLVVAVRAVGLHGKEGLDTPIDVMSQDHFPLNWYTRDFTKVGYWGDAVDPRPGSVAIVSGPNRESFHGRIGGDYMERTFTLRPGVDLTVAIPVDAFEQAREDLPAPGRWSRVGPINLPADLGAGLAGNAPLEPGLVAATYADGKFTGPARSVRVGRPVLVDYDSGQNKEWDGTIGIEWRGILDVPVEGLYKFELTSDDGARLVIDGHVIVDGWGRHAQETRSGSARMGAGRHAFHVEYVDYGGGAKLWVRWSRPGGIEEPLPASRLFHERGKETADGPSEGAAR